MPFWAGDAMNDSGTRSFTGSASGDARDGGGQRYWCESAIWPLPLPRRPRLLWLGALVAMAGAGTALIPVLTRRSPLSARDRRWQQDIADVARELPRVHVRGLGKVRRPVWEAGRVQVRRASAAAQRRSTDLSAWPSWWPDSAMTRPS